MGNTAITGDQIWWSQNDVYGSGVGGSTGDGKRFLEVMYRKKFGPASLQNSYLITGGTVPGSDADLTITVAAGSANIDGHFVQWPATNVTLPDDQTSHVFLKLVFASQLVTGLELEDNATDVPPASSLKLFEAVAASGVISSTTDRRIGPGLVTAELFTSNGTFKVPAGVYRAKIRIYGSTGGGGSGGDGGGPSNGSSGNTGGTTSVGSLMSVNGGGGGGAGQGGGSGGSNGSDATVTTGIAIQVAAVMIVGSGGAGISGGGPGGNGGRGLYAEKLVSLTPGDSHTVTIGTGGAGSVAGSGGAGGNGQAGRVVIEYL